MICFIMRHGAHTCCISLSHRWVASRITVLNLHVRSFLLQQGNQGTIQPVTRKADRLHALIVVRLYGIVPLAAVGKR
jgi:hypothetical protein